MNDQISNEGIWPTWLQQAMWLEWLQPLLYVLPAIAMVRRVLVLLDFTMPCWKEFHASRAPKTNIARTKLTPVSEVKQESVGVLKQQSYDAINVWVLLLCCGAYSSVIFAQSLNTAVRDGDLKQVKTLLAKGTNINTQDADGTTPSRRGEET